MLVPAFFTSLRHHADAPANYTPGTTYYLDQEKRITGDTQEVSFFSPAVAVQLIARTGRLLLSSLHLCSLAPERSA